MKDSIFLTISRQGVVSMNKRDRPRLSRGERFIQVDLEVADSIFEPDPIPTVTLKVVNPYEVHPPEISVSDVQADIRGLNETWSDQIKVNRAAARLLELGLNSGDDQTQREAVAILAGLKDDGIRVDINVPELPEAPNV